MAYFWQDILFCMFDDILYYGIFFITYYTLAFLMTYCAKICQIFDSMLYYITFLRTYDTMVYFWCHKIIWHICDGLLCYGLFVKPYYAMTWWLHGWDSPGAACGWPLLPLWVKCKGHILLYLYNIRCTLIVTIKWIHLLWRHTLYYCILWPIVYDTIIYV